MTWRGGVICAISRVALPRPPTAQMAKAGLFLNILGVIVISVLGSLLIPMFLVG